MIPAKKETNEINPASVLLPAREGVGGVWRERGKDSTEILKDLGARDWSSGRLRQQCFARQSPWKELSREVP